MRGVGWLGGGELSGGSSSKRLCSMPPCCSVECRELWRARLGMPVLAYWGRLLLLETSEVGDTTCSLRSWSASSCMVGETTDLLELGVAAEA